MTKKLAYIVAYEGSYPGGSHFRSWNWIIAESVQDAIDTFKNENSRLYTLCSILRVGKVER